MDEENLQICVSVAEFSLRKNSQSSSFLQGILASSSISWALSSNFRATKWELHHWGFLLTGFAVNVPLSTSQKTKNIENPPLS